MNKLIRNIALVAGLAAATCASAQNTYSGYFINNYLYRSEMNPAFGNAENYVGFPGLGNLNAGMAGNLHLDNIFYNIDGRTCLFTNPGVSAAEVLDGIHDVNKLGVSTKVDIINVGFKGLGGYNTVGISARADVRTHIPGSIFSLLKEGVENKTYDIADFRARGTAFAQIALNHSHDIKAVPGLRVGGTLKVLIGGAQVDARLDKARLELHDDTWNIVTDATIETSMKGLSYTTSYNDDARRDYVDGVEIDGPGPNGFGLGFDLGAEYKWGDFTFSAAVLDLGFIHWNETRLAGTDGERMVQTSRYQFGADSDTNDTEWDNLKNDLTALYQLDDLGDTGGRTTALSATVNAGVNYALPAYRNLTFGLLNSTYINGPYTSTEFRLSANVRPVKCLAASANLAAGTYGVGFGWLINLNLHKGFSFFVGMDHTMGKLAKQGVPLKSNAKFNLGIDFPF